MDPPRALETLLQRFRPFGYTPFVRAEGDGVLVQAWPLGWRVGIVAAQFAAIALWARTLVRWIRGMDELHRRITATAALFATSATFFFLMLWHRLDAAGLFNAIFPSLKSGGSWDICTVGHGFLLLTLFYFVSHSVFNRRYK